MKPNTQFKLSVADIALIEAALQQQLSEASDEKAKEIHNLLGSLHNQKNWYRPTKKPYIGG